MDTRQLRRSSRWRARIAALTLGALLVSGCTLASALDPRDALTGLRPVATDGPLPAATPVPTQAPAEVGGGDLTGGRRLVPPLKRRGPFTLDLYRAGDHVPQYTDSWCVGASMQMMINIIERGRPDRSRTTQERLYRFARKTSPWVESRPGASVYGWSEGLERLGYGPYEELSGDTRQAALRIAARQMRLTRKPVGLLVWAGDHAWVMSGFKATADPAATDDFTVTHVWVEDPWAGRSSRIWGPGLGAHTLLSVDELARDYLRYDSVYRPQYGERGEFVVVAPL
jgi:hypothetical protein